MRLYELDGSVHCYNCKRAFDVDPRIKEKENAQRCRQYSLNRCNNNEDTAAFLSRCDAIDKETEHWTDGCGAGDTWGSIVDTGLYLSLAPNANPEEVMQTVDEGFLPMLRKQIERKVVRVLNKVQ